MLAIADAILVPAGLLIAAGDRGVHLLSGEGDTLAHWDVRATDLVIADGGTSALIGERSGQTFSLHRVDLSTSELAALGTVAGYVRSRTATTGTRW